MNKHLDKTLVDALSFCGLRALPDKWDDEHIYLRALALVTKADATKSYVLLQKDDTGHDKIVKDFGTIAVIRTIDSIHPFFYLDSKWIPTFKGSRGKGKVATDLREAKIAWLQQWGRSGNFEAMSDNNIDHEILCVAIQAALEQNKL